MFFKLFKLIRAVLRTILIVVSNIYTTVAYCIWVLLILAIKPINKNLYIKLEGILYDCVLSVVSLWIYSADYKIIEIGANILSECKNGKVLILANHQSTSDVQILMALFNSKKYIRNNIMWIMDRIFCITHFGWISYLHGDCFILSGQKVRDEAKRKLQQHLINSFLPLNRKFIVLFPEGGFLRKRRESSRRYAKERKITNTIRNVALPRIGAIQTILDVMRLQCNESNSCKLIKDDDCQIKWIIDLTIAYENRVPLDIQTIWTGWRNPCTTYIVYRLLPATQIPYGQANVTDWLYNFWEEKDNILENIYKAEKPLKCFSIYQNNEKLVLYPTEVKQNLFRLISENIFLFLSTYLHYQLACYLFTLV